MTSPLRPGAINLASLTINYRTPEEVMTEVEPVIRAVLPDASMPTSISSSLPVVHGSASGLGSILDTWLAAHADGLACVIGDPTFRATSRIRDLRDTRHQRRAAILAATSTAISIALAASGEWVRHFPRARRFRGAAAVAGVRDACGAGSPLRTTPLLAYTDIRQLFRAVRQW
jgi:hypothetical protein